MPNEPNSPKEPVGPMRAPRDDADDPPHASFNHTVAPTIGWLFGALSTALLIICSMGVYTYTTSRADEKAFETSITAGVAALAERLRQVEIRMGPSAPFPSFTPPYPSPTQPAPAPVLQPPSPTTAGEFPIHKH